MRPEEYQRQHSSETVCSAQNGERGVLSWFDSICHLAQLQLFPPLLKLNLYNPEKKTNREKKCFSHLTEEFDVSISLRMHPRSLISRRTSSEKYNSISACDMNIQFALNVIRKISIVTEQKFLNSSTRFFYPPPCITRDSGEQCGKFYFFVCASNVTPHWVLIRDWILQTKICPEILITFNPPSSLSETYLIWKSFQHKMQELIFNYFSIHIYNLFLSLFQLDFTTLFCLGQLYKNCNILHNFILFCLFFLC